MTVIYNGINTDYLQSAESKIEFRRRLNLSMDAPVIFASGNFRFAKGFDLLMLAMAGVINKYPKNAVKPVLVITGEGELQNQMAEQVKQLGISEQVRLLGFRTDMPLIMKAADLFVLPSRWEGCPMVILESMALGIPIVATDVGGVPELVMDGQTGILVPPGSPTALANGIHTLLHDKELAACLAEQGQRRLSQSFSIDRNARAMTTLYRQMAGYVI